MTPPNNIKKVAKDMFATQMKWSIWFLFVMLIGAIAHAVIVINKWALESPIADYFAFTLGASRIYMLVIGIIIAYSFLTYFVNHGITRKDYFYGASLAALGLSISLAIVSGLLTAVEFLVLHFLNIEVTFTGFALLTFDNNWLQLCFIFTLNVLAYYLTGWFISSSYYRYGWKLGTVLTIVIGGGALVIMDLLWENGEFLANMIVGNIYLISFLGNIVLIIILLTIIRAVTRRVTIKM